MAHDENVIVLRQTSPTAWLLLLLTLVGGAGAFYFWQEALQEERAEVKEREEELSGKAKASRDALRSLEEQLSTLQEANLTLTRENESLSRQVEEATSQLDQLKATYESLEDKMKAEIAAGQVLLKQSAGRIQVDLVDKILFESGQATLSEPGKEVLSRLGTVLAQVQDRQIQVSGHTDDSPISDRLKETFPSNWELSTARAVNVVRHLQQASKIKPQKLIAAGYGEFHPVASNAKPEGRARNRRIEILLTPTLAKKKIEAAATTSTRGVKAQRK